MAVEEIEWNIAVCASTYAELGEAWATLRLINAQLEEPDGGRVLNESGAAGYYKTAHELVADTLRGLDQFLSIQGNYLEGIRRGVHVDLSELKNLVADSGPEKAPGGPAPLLAENLLPVLPPEAAPGLNPETYATRTDFSSGEIYPGLFAFETPPPWLTSWLQYVAYGSYTGQVAAANPPWTEQVQYSNV